MLFTPVLGTRYCSVCTVKEQARFVGYLHSGSAYLDLVSGLETGGCSAAFAFEPTLSKQWV